ncbi:MAG: radical SAM protein [Candidatus Schekmanbacteria bacterium]|nr:radical SAM protein [Candidatus Schekmanbacteria bacterium]
MTVAAAPHPVGVSATPRRFDKSRIRRALLVYPPSGLFDRTDRCQTPIAYASAQGARPPMDIAYIAAGLIAEGIACQLVDYPAEQLGWSAFRRDLEVLRPNLLVLSITSFAFDLDMEACTIVKEMLPACLTVAKGAHFKLAPAECLELYPQLDMVIWGESELVLPEVFAAERLADVAGIAARDDTGAPFVTPERPALRDLDRLPLPARHLINNELYRLPNTGEKMTTIIVGRGCPHECIFCLVPAVTGKKAVYRSPGSVVSEIRDCVERFGIRQFLLKADAFTINRKWVLAFCDAVAIAGLEVGFISNSRVDGLDEEVVTALARAGWWMLAIGVESGNQDILNHVKKGATVEQAETAVRLCRKHGIRTFAYFTIGFPADTRRTVLDTIHFALRLDPDFCEFHPAFPFPGTVLHDMGEKLGLLHIGGNAGRGVMPRQFLRSQALDLRQINRLRIYGLMRFYLRPRFIWRTLRSVSGPAEVLRYLSAAAEKIWTTVRYTLSRQGW